MGSPVEGAANRDRLYAELWLSILSIKRPLQDITAYGYPVLKTLMSD